MTCSQEKNIELHVLDTDFSKGRLTENQVITISDLKKFHGHECDGLVMGTLAIQQAMNELYPNAPIDRTSLNMVSKPSPCLTDVVVYLTGARYQFETFYVDTTFNGLYIIQRTDNHKTVMVSLKAGIKPKALIVWEHLQYNKNFLPAV